MESLTGPPALKWYTLSKVENGHARSESAMFYRKLNGQEFVNLLSSFTQEKELS